MDFTGFNTRLKKVISNFDNIILEAAMESKETIADLQVEQLEEGKTEKGTNIIPEYQSESYASAKKAIGAKPPKFTPDLKLTGDFHRGIYAKLEKNYIVTDSTDDKTGMLTEKYPDIWGLSDQKQAQFNKEVAPNIAKRLKNELLAS